MKKSLIVAVLALGAWLAGPAQALDGGVESLRETSKAFASVGRAVSPSVVFIQVEGQRGASTQTQVPHGLPFGDALPFGEEFFEFCYRATFQQHVPVGTRRLDVLLLGARAITAQRG